MNTQIISIANQKGGVSKTTTCLNLGIGLKRTGKKVLLIDLDPQASLTVSLGNPHTDQLEITVSDMLTRIILDKPVKQKEGILHFHEGVDYLLSNIQLSGAEFSLINAMSRETVLKQYLDTVKGLYSHILIDCPPSLGMLRLDSECVNYAFDCIDEASGNIRCIKPYLQKILFNAPVTMDSYIEAQANSALRKYYGGGTVR